MHALGGLTLLDVIAITQYIRSLGQKIQCFAHAFRFRFGRDGIGVCLLLLVRIGLNVIAPDERDGQNERKQRRRQQSTHRPITIHLLKPFSE